MIPIDGDDNNDDDLTQEARTGRERRFQLLDLDTLTPPR